MTTATNGHSVPAISPPPDSEVFNAREVVQILQGLMVKVTTEECTASTVQAACQCSARIAELLRLHLDVERLKRDDDKIRRAELRLQGRTP